jgi:hypothetical protein
VRADEEHSNFSVGDVVLVHPDVAHCEAVQAHPDSSGWNKEMQAACGSEGVVVAVATDKDGQQFVEVKHERTSTGAFTWSWHSSLLVLVSSASVIGLEACKAEVKDETPAGASSIGEKLVEHLREELLVLQKARGDVRKNTAKLLGISVIDPTPRVEADILQACEESMQNSTISPAVLATVEPVPTADSQVEPTPPAVLLRRTLTDNSARAVQDLGTSVAPVDMQRARHLLKLARLWGDSELARKRRITIHNSARQGDLDSVARQIRHYNTMDRVEHALWQAAGRKTACYRVSPNARIELLADPHHGAQRTGFVLHPGCEFASTREALDIKGLHWLRVGSVPTVIEAFRQESTRQSSHGRVDMTDMPGAIGARVMRGPDWVNPDYDNGNEDGGPGGLGRIVGYGSPENEFIKVQ